MSLRMTRAERERFLAEVHVGVISIAGPRTRLTPARMQALAPALLAATAELGPISRASTLFGRPPLGKA